MRSGDADDWMDAINTAHSSIPTGTRYNTGMLLMVLSRPVDVNIMYPDNSGGTVIVEKTAEGEQRDGGGLV